MCILQTANIQPEQPHVVSHESMDVTFSVMVVASADRVGYVYMAGYNVRNRATIISDIDNSTALVVPPIDSKGIDSVGASPDSDSDSMGESESECGLESGLRLYPCGLGLGLHLCGLGLKRCGLGLWPYGLGLQPGGLGLTVSPGESGEKCSRQI